MCPRGGDRFNKDVGIEPGSEEREIFAKIGTAIFGSRLNKPQVWL